MHALLVGAAPCSGDGVSRIMSLASSADLVIAVDGGGEHCLRARVIPHVIVGDLDSLSQATELELKAAGSVQIRYPADKDESDLDLALALARDRGADSITLTCVLGGRLDQTLATLGSAARVPQLRPLIVESDVCVWMLDSDHVAEVELDLSVTRLTVMALLGPATVSAEGVKWPLEHAELPALSSFGLSNVRSAAVARISVSRGSCAVIVDERP